MLNIMRAIYSHINFGIEIWGAAATKYRHTFKITKKRNCYFNFIFSLCFESDYEKIKVHFHKDTAAIYKSGNLNFFRVGTNKKRTDNDPFIKGVLFNKLPEYLKKLENVFFKRTEKLLRTHHIV